MPVAAPAPASPDEDRISASVTMLGDDRKGVVAQVTQYLFEQGGNIDALEEQVSRGFFSMNLLASWERDRLDRSARERIAGDLESLGDDLGMETRVRFHEPDRTQRMAVFVTKESACLEAIVEAREADELDAEPVVVIGNVTDLESIADDADLPFVHVPFENRDEAEDQIIQLVDDRDIDLLVLARFMKVLSPLFCWRYRNRIINVHPSLLPAFPGAKAYRQAWEKGVRVVGATAHFVTPDLDQGPIIHQEAFQVDPSDSLEAIRDQGRQVEADVLLEAIRIYLDKDLDVHWGRVWMDDGD